MTTPTKANNKNPIISHSEPAEESGSWLRYLDKLGIGKVVVAVILNEAQRNDRTCLFKAYIQRRE